MRHDTVQAEKPLTLHTIVKSKKPVSMARGQPRYLTGMVMRVMGPFLLVRVDGPKPKQDWQQARDWEPTTPLTA